ncbi:MAG: hypothetical protein U1E39_09205 [Planctomycetota bacterium]
MTHARRPSPVLAALVAALLASAGCGAKEAGPAPAASSPSFLLAADPGEAVSVEEARRRGAADEVVVVGRVREITKGLAAFTLVDLSQKYCGQTEMEGCPTPWDYCCIPKEELARHMIGVSVRAGNDVALGDVGRDLRNLDVVAVRGRLVKEKDEVFLHATGWFRRERPKLPDGLEFPR